MAKSLRSKWKKRTRALKAKKVAPIVAERVEKLHGKLTLASEGKLGRVPMVEPTTRFTHSAPKISANEPLILDPLTTKVVTYGVDRPTRATRPHAQHPSRQGDRFKLPGEERVITEEEEADPNFDASASRIAQTIQDAADDDAEEVTMVFGAEEGMMKLGANKRSAADNRKRFTDGIKATRVQQGTKKKSAAKKKFRKGEE